MSTNEPRLISTSPAPSEASTSPKNGLSEVKTTTTPAKNTHNPDGLYNAFGGGEPNWKDGNTISKAVKEADFFTPRRLDDGGMYEWVWEPLPLPEQAPWAMVRDAIGCTPSEAYQEQNLVGDIAKLVFERVGDDPAKVQSFIHAQLRRIPSMGNKLYSLARNLRYQAVEYQNSQRKGGD